MLAGAASKEGEEGRGGGGLGGGGGEAPGLDPARAFTGLATPASVRQPGPIYSLYPTNPLFRAAASVWFKPTLRRPDLLL